MASTNRKQKKIQQKPPVYLQNIIKKHIEHQKHISNFEFDNNDCAINLTKFNNSINLFDYQQEAIEYFYFFMLKAFKQSKHSDNNLLDQGYKEASANKYNLDNLNIDLDQVKHKKSKIDLSLYHNYLEIINEVKHKQQEQYNYDNINYFDLIHNRANFWMATGSGKTIVMVKAIAVLFELMLNSVIPVKPVMILAPTDNILKQIKQAVTQFNHNQCHDFTLECKNLKDNWEDDNKYYTGNNQNILYDGSASGISSLAGMSRYAIYYYRADNFVDNIADTAKKKNNDAKKIYYKHYLANNGWYLFLDEAHRGESGISSRKVIFDILSAQGALFNFSATFTDNIDIITTLYEFNLSTFLKDGFGKKLYISETDVSNLGKIEQDKISQQQENLNITKSLILLASCKKSADLLQNEIDAQLYHRPLMMILASKVNKTDDGLKPFFDYLLSLIQNGINADLFARARSQLIKELSNQDNFKFGLDLDQASSKSIKKTVEDLQITELYQYVFYADSLNTQVEVTYIKNKNELAFKLKNANKGDYFALLVIDEAHKWIEEWVNTDNHNVFFEYRERSYTRSIFTNINDRANKISILMGSQIFKEGWDSNRPNIICYLGIGLDSSNKKYITQTIGRGVRIEPYLNQRKRVDHIKLSELLLSDKSKLTHEQIIKIKQLAPIIETEFILASSVYDINEICKNIEEQSYKSSSSQESDSNDFRPINELLQKELITKNDKIKQIECEFLIPKYNEDGEYQKNPFNISTESAKKLREYMRGISDKVLILKHNISSVGVLNKIGEIRNNDSTNEILRTYPQHQTQYLSTSAIIEKIKLYLNKKVTKLEKLAILTNEIKHYTNIATNIHDKDDLYQLEKELFALLQHYNPQDNNIELSQLYKQVQHHEISMEDFNLHIDLSKINFKYFNFNKKLDKLLQYHYYQPILYINKKEDSNAEHFKYIINEPSEIEFLEELSEYTAKLDKKYQWWYFSKINELQDKDIYIPYHDWTTNIERKFYPDFIFWIKTLSGDLKLVFVDPKGYKIGRDNIEDKIHGYETIFHEHRNKVYLKLYNTEAREQNYWFISLSELFNDI